MRIIDIETRAFTDRRPSPVWTLFFVIVIVVIAALKTAAQQPDFDGDGVPDNRDNCRTVPNWEEIVFRSGGNPPFELFSIHPNGGNQVNLTNNPVFDGDAAVSPDGSKIVFVSTRDTGGVELFVMNIDGSNPTRITDDPLRIEIFPSFSPDSSKIIFTGARNNSFEIYTINVDGSNQTRLTNTSRNFDPSFSPDGSKIAFTSDRGGDQQIYVMNIDGSNQIPLTNVPQGGYLPKFSPDGSKIAFVSSREGGDSAIFLMNADGTNQTNLTNVGISSSEFFHVFSPDGSKIAFVRTDTFANNEIYIMNADGSNQINLTNNPAVDLEPKFSPDGGRIVYQSSSGNETQVFIINIDGSNRRQLTNNPDLNLKPEWAAQADSDHDGIGDACENIAPSFEINQVSRQQGASFVSIIAQVIAYNQNPRGVAVTVNGSTSATVNGVTISEIDTFSFPIGSVRARVSAACGATDANFTLRVIDVYGQTGEATLHVSVSPETSPPVINLRPGGMALFPPNHQYAAIGVDQMVASVSDNCSAMSTNDVVINKATSDEADDATGDSDGSTIGDIVIAAGCRTVRLRAERDGNRNGRVYTVTLTARDEAGNTTLADFSISVPIGQNGSPAVRDATALTINGGCS